MFEETLLGAREELEAANMDTVHESDRAANEHVRTRALAVIADMLAAQASDDEAAIENAAESYVAFRTEFMGEGPHDLLAKRDDGQDVILHHLVSNAVAIVLLAGDPNVEFTPLTPAEAAQFDVR